MPLQDPALPGVAMGSGVPFREPFLKHRELVWDESMMFDDMAEPAEPLVLFRNPKEEQLHERNMERMRVEIDRLRFMLDIITMGIFVGSMLILALVVGTFGAILHRFRLPPEEREPLTFRWSRPGPNGQTVRSK